MKPNLSTTPTACDIDRKIGWIAAGLWRATASMRVRCPMPTPLGVRNSTLRGARASRRSASRGGAASGAPNMERSRRASASGPISRWRSASAARRQACAAAGVRAASRSATPAPGSR